MFHLCDCPEDLSESEGDQTPADHLERTPSPSADDILRAAKATRRIQRAFQTHHKFPTPVFVRGKGWHLSDANVQVNSLSGIPGKICQVPTFPPGATPQQQLQILKDDGYELVEQHQ
jgi:hypothetical protein